MGSWFDSGTVVTTDSSGEVQNRYKSSPSGTDESTYNETVRIGPAGEATELFVEARDPVQFFPYFGATKRMPKVLSADGSVTVTRRHRPFFDITVSPVVGGSLPHGQVHVGATFARIGPAFLGASVGANRDRLSLVAEVSTDVATRLNVSVGITHRRQVNVGIRYRF
jgi:hypothetical protein